MQEPARTSLVDGAPAFRFRPFTWRDFDRVRDLLERRPALELEEPLGLVTTAAPALGQQLAQVAVGCFRTTPAHLGSMAPPATEGMLKKVKSRRADGHGQARPGALNCTVA